MNFLFIFILAAWLNSAVTIVLCAYLQVGTMGAEGYCVNIPWKCGGVGDGDYIFAFQHIVIPIGTSFSAEIWPVFQFFFENLFFVWL